MSELPEYYATYQIARRPNPNIDRLESADGKYVIERDGFGGPSRDASGERFLFTIFSEKNPIQFRPIIQSQNSSRASAYYRDQGKDYESLTRIERTPTLYKFMENHGSHRAVILFESPTNTPPRATYIQAFCEMYLRLTASYRYNNLDYPACGEGHYPDMIIFAPYEVDRALQMTLRAEDVL